MSFQQLTYPRRKNFIKNLNILLDSSPILSPEKSIATKLLTRNFSQELSSKVIPHQRSSLKNPIKVIQDRKLFSLRKVQQKKQLGIVQNNLPSRTAKSAHLTNSKRNFETNIPIQPRVLDSEASPRRINRTQGSFQGKKSQININDQFEGNLEFVMSKSAQFSKSTQPCEADRYQSVEIKRSSEGVLYDYSPKQQRKKEYLKKGSRIKTSIMHNILKMKLLSKQNPQRYEGQNHIQSKEIFKLIKLYKGTLLTERVQKKQEPQTLSKKQVLKLRQKDPLYIQGWLNDVESQEQNEHCC